MGEEPGDCLCSAGFSMPISLLPLVAAGLRLGSANTETLDGLVGTALIRAISSFRDSFCVLSVSRCCKEMLDALSKFADFRSLFSFSSRAILPRSSEDLSSTASLTLELSDSSMSEF